MAATMAMMGMIRWKQEQVRLSNEDVLRGHEYILACR